MLAQLECFFVSPIVIVPSPYSPLPQKYVCYLWNFSYNNPIVPSDPCWFSYWGKFTILRQDFLPSLYSQPPCRLRKLVSQLQDLCYLLLQDCFNLNQACCAGCRHRPFLMQLHQQANSPIQQNRPNFLSRHAIQIFFVIFNLLNLCNIVQSMIGSC